MLRTGDRKGSAQTKTLLFGLKILAKARKAGPPGSSCTEREGPLEVGSPELSCR